MGNELLSPAGNVTTAVSGMQTMPMQNSLGFNNVSSVFNSALNGKNYNNDMMMPDFIKTGNLTAEQRASIFGPMNTAAPQTQNYTAQQAAYPQSQPQTQTAQPAFSGQTQAPQLSPEQLTQYYNDLLANNPNIRITEKGNIYEVTNAGKKTGILTGIIGGLAGGIVKLCKGEALSKAFTLKSLAVKLPVLAVAGWAVGSVIDAFTNSSSAKKADELSQQV